MHELDIKCNAGGDNAELSRDAAWGWRLMF